MRLFQKNNSILILLLVVLSFLPIITSNLMRNPQNSKYITDVSLNSAEISETSTSFFAQSTDFESSEYINEVIVTDNEENNIPNLNLLINSSNPTQSGFYIGEHKRWADQVTYGNYYNNMELGNLNGDNFLDRVLNNDSVLVLKIHNGDKYTGYWGTSDNYTTKSFPAKSLIDVKLAQFSQNNRFDIITLTTPGNISGFYYDGSLVKYDEFQLTVTANPINCSLMRVFDIDNAQPAINEVLIHGINPITNNTYIFIVRNQTSTTFDANPYYFQLSNNATFKDLTVVDVNEDSRKDIVVVNENGIYFYLQNTSNEFPSGPSKQLNGNYVKLEFGDLDSDTLLDLVVLDNFGLVRIFYDLDISQAPNINPDTTLITTGIATDFVIADLPDSSSWEADSLMDIGVVVKIGTVYKFMMFYQRSQVSAWWIWFIIIPPAVLIPILIYYYRRKKR